MGLVPGKNLENFFIAGSDPDKHLFLQNILPELGSEKALACAFGGPKGVFKKNQEKALSMAALKI